MAGITLDQIEAAYTVGKQVYAGQITQKAGVSVLAEKHGMNEASAINFIGNFKQMRKGVAYHRTQSLQATRRYFDNFLSDYGVAGLALAVQASRAHVDYYESLGRGRRPALRDLCDEYDHLIENSSDTVYAKFEHDVSLSLADSSFARKARLEKYSGDVTEKFVNQRVFVRNPDVVAEALVRADGQCEFCNEEAPFVKVNGLPYLEVHHRTPLAEGGKDILENTLALCPNCHREAHYGKDALKFRH